MVRPAIALVSLIQSVLLSYCALIPRHPILSIPIRFEDGFAVVRSFAVDTSSRYMLLLEFQKDTPLAIRRGSAPDEFEAEFSISFNKKPVMIGTSESTPRQGTFKSNHTARDLAIFDAEVGKSYELSFRIIRADPILRSTKPVVTIWLVPPGSL
jgi:hypothetical protein